MQRFNKQKKHCIKNYGGYVKTRSLSLHKNTDTLTHLKIKTT
jgi:hypothetical protein